MKKLKPSDFADKAAFQKEQRRMCGVRKAEREAVAARQAAASLASAKEAKRAKQWECHQLLEGHDWLDALCYKVDQFNESCVGCIDRTPSKIMDDYFRIRRHKECLSHHEAVKRLLFEYKYLMDSDAQRGEGASYNSEEEVDQFLGAKYQVYDDVDFHIIMDFDWQAHGYENSI
jgi:hypothetical protein